MAQRAEWTDDRIDDKMSAMDATFARIDESLRDLRAEMRDVRAELTAGPEGLRSSRDQLRDRMMLAGFASTALIAGIVAVLLKA